MILVDGHVHWHEPVALSDLMDAAWTNGTSIADREGRRLDACVLFLVDMAGQDSFDRLRNEKIDGWSEEAHAEEELAKLFVGPVGQKVVLIAGSQVSTSERIEILAVGTRARFPDNLDSRRTIEAMRDTSPLIVLPWAFGKWWGSRGQLVAELARTGSDDVFIGDNGTRPRYYPRSRIFSLDRSANPLVLPGTDPLPLPGDHRRCGSYGMAYEGTLDLHALWSELRRCLVNSEGFGTIGTRVSWADFAIKQINLRARSDRQL